MSMSTSRPRAVKALLVVLGLALVIWVVQIVNVYDAYRLTIDGALRARDVYDLPAIFSAPFLHWSWAHIEGNTWPLLKTPAQGAASGGGPPTTGDGEGGRGGPPGRFGLCLNCPLPARDKLSIDDGVRLQELYEGALQLLPKR